MKVRTNKTILLILVVIAGLFLFTACTSNVLENGKEVSYETPKVLRATNLGAELPFIAYESEHRVVFYHGMGLFVYNLDNS